MRASPFAGRQWSPFLVLFVVSAVLSCGGDSPSEPSNRAPTITIQSPADGTTVLEGTNLVLQASASDPEDGDIGSSITWSSDVDGSIGNGAVLSTNTLSVGAHTLSAEVSDSGGMTATASVSIEILGDDPPSVQITEPADGTEVVEGTEVSFVGSATDAADGTLSGSIEWESDVDGPLGTGADVTAVLALGTHQVTASVSDSRGQAASASVAVTVVPNTAPILSITTPGTGSSLPEDGWPGIGAVASDSEDGDLGNQVAWSSDIDGDLGTGSGLTPTFSPGTHEIVASVTDSRGASAADTISLTVVATGDVQISGTEQIFNFDLTSIPPGPAYSNITWRVLFNDTDPVSGTDEIVTTLYGAEDGVGPVQVRNDTDNIGEGGTVYGPLTTANPIYDPMLDGGFSFGLEMTSGTASLAAFTACGIRFVDNVARRACITHAAGVPLSPPSVSISAPADGSTFPEGADITFTGSATDPEDGDLSGSMAWTSNLDGALGTGAVVASVLSVGTHTITAAVTDSDSQTTSTSITVVVNAAPSVSISAPSDGATLNTGSTTTFSGTASDPEDGDLTESMAWSSSLDGDLGTGGSVDAVLSEGTHTITATVTDPDGASGSASIEVVVEPSGVVTVSATDDAAVEDEASSGTFTVSRTGSTTLAVTVNYTIGGTATAGSDYSTLTGDVTIGEGQASATVVVDPIADGPVEDPETVILTLAAGNYTIGDPSTATVTITDASAPATLINGENHTGTIGAPGELHSWTFDAAAGDFIAVNIGEVGTGTDFVPWIRLISPSSSLVAGDFGGLAAQVNVENAPETGTYTVIVGSNDSGQDGTGDYRLTLVHVPGTFVVPTGDDGGSLTNGDNHTGSIAVGDFDQWTFEATAGDWISVNIGELADGTGFVPWIRLVSPTGASITGDFGGVAAQLTVANAPETGTYTVVVGTNDSGRDGTGDYQLTLARVPGSFVVPTGDEGGALGNGENHTGSIHLGDLDQWTFEATAGDWISVNVGELADGTGFVPWIRLVSPTGASITGDFGGVAAQLTVANAPETGRYTVVVGTNDSGRDGTGDYQLTLARVPGTFVVPTGDHGGSLTNGGNHTGSIHLGDLDQWTFQATAGDWISVNIGELADGTGFVPWIRLISPSGAPVASDFGSIAAQVTDQNAAETGTYTVVVGTNDSGRDGTGDYQLTLARVPGSFVVPTGDEGGALTNGENHTGSIHLGDLDQWTFEATAGDWISVNIGELANGTGFVPWIRLISPSGALVAGDFGSIAAQVTDQNAGETGTYTVVVGTNDSGREGTGDYQLTLARVPGTFVVPTGDEGGSITNGGNHTGSIHLGDLDQWTFDATAGDWISVNIGELADGTGFVPWIRLISPSGALVAGDFGSIAAQVTDQNAAETGTYTVVVGTNDSGRDGTGDYEFTLMKVPGTLAIPTGDEGGAMTDGVDHAGAIDLGDLDPWTFSASAGESLTLDLTETTDITDFVPWVRLISPSGSLVAGDFDATAAQVSVTSAPETGTYTVIVGTNDSGRDGTGEYLVTLSR